MGERGWYKNENIGCTLLERSLYERIRAANKNLKEKEAAEETLTAEIEGEARALIHRVQLRVVFSLFLPLRFD